MPWRSLFSFGNMGTFLNLLIITGCIVVQAHDSSHGSHMRHTTNECDIHRADRVYIPGYFRTQCVANGGCYDDNQSFAKRCYRKKDDKCNVPKDDRTASNRVTKRDCERAEECWDDFDAQCYQRRYDSCMAISPNCKFVSRSDCVVSGGRDCGVGFMLEKRECFNTDDPNWNGASEIINIYRPCCDKKCTGGREGSGPGSGKSDSHGKGPHGSGKSDSHGKGPHGSGKSDSHGKGPHGSGKSDSHGKGPHGSGKSDSHGKGPHGSGKSGSHGKGPHGSGKGSTGSGSHSGNNFPRCYEVWPACEQ